MTHTMKHTPGPWEVVGSRICTVANDKERRTLAKTEPGGAFAMSEQQEANATLLAAAPAMYEALQIMVRAANVDEIDPLVMFASIERAKDALAQEDGEGILP